MNNPSSLRTPHSEFRIQETPAPTLRIPHSPLRTQIAAFTLVEMLVVIAIIGLLASLVLTGAGIATVKMRRAKVEAMRDAIVTAIDSYQHAKGFYPPDNSLNNTNVNSVQSSLYYELTGTIASSTPPTATTTFQVADGTVFIAKNFYGCFNIGDPLSGVGGFLNSALPTDANSVVNYLKSLKNDQHQIVNLSSGVGSYVALGLNIPGPLQLAGTGGGKGSFNPWHYVSSNPTNNTGTYDLWMDVAWSGKTNRVSNWSKDPQVVY